MQIGRNHQTVYFKERVDLMMSNFNIKKVAVLGSGVMGSQIAAHCVNSNIPVILFDLPTQSKDGNPVDRTSIAKKAVGALQKLKPSPLTLQTNADLIVPANYDDHLNLLQDCDLVIEAIAEKFEWKNDLYQKVSPYISKTAVFASNTSGISIETLSKGIPGDLKERFCGIHFFNPPRYMHLLELIPSTSTAPKIVDALETFATSVWGKGVVRAKDTPNFIANRIGVFSILNTIATAEKFNLNFDLVDQLTGEKIGRAKSATFRTCDIVGIDTLVNVVKTMESALKGDPFAHSYQLPLVLSSLVGLGFLGQKTGAGFYKRVGKDNLVFNKKTGSYEPGNTEISSAVLEILKSPTHLQIGLFRSSQDLQAQFIWEIYRNLFHFVAIHLDSIAHSAADVDFAMRWGYGWSKGPFELWQEAGWEEVAKWIEEDIGKGRALISQSLPKWVSSNSVISAGGVHSKKGSWSPQANDFVVRTTLPVYHRQVFKAPLLGDGNLSPSEAGSTVRETESARMWVDQSFERVLILSFKSKANTIGSEVLKAIAEAVSLAEKSYDGLVIWQASSIEIGGGAKFSAGADLAEAMKFYERDGQDGIESYVKEFQDTMSLVKYSSVPVVAAVSGFGLGGGCELLMQSAKRVVSPESYVGLVEAGVGLLPAGGGLKELAIDCSRKVELTGNNIFLDYIKPKFMNVALAKVSGSAQEAIQMGFLRESDIIVPNAHEILYQALLQVNAMAQSGYRPPMKRSFKVGGRSLKATLKGVLVNMRDGGFVSEHDFFIGEQIAHVISGGDLDTGALISEEWLLKLERQAFARLFATPKTQERIAHTLKTRKPLRN